MYRCPGALGEQGRAATWLCPTLGSGLQQAPVRQTRAWAGGWQGVMLGCREARRPGPGLSPRTSYPAWAQNPFLHLPLVFRSLHVLYSFEKTLMLGGIGGRRRRGRQRMGWLDGITDSMDMGLGGLREWVTDGEAWRAVVHGVAELDITQ